MSWIDPSNKQRPTKLLHTRATCRELRSACAGWRNPITKFISLLLRKCRSALSFPSRLTRATALSTLASFVFTHGVGPMRKYCIGATLLDLHDPARIIGQLKEPLLRPKRNEREGYVPNVVYSCGALVHNGQLILPYGVSDTASSIVRIELRELLTALT